MYANIRGYGSKYLRWVSYINCIMHVYRIYQASRLYADFVASGAAARARARSLFSLSLLRRRIKAERRTANKVHENAINPRPGRKREREKQREKEREEFISRDAPRYDTRIAYSFLSSLYIITFTRGVAHLGGCDTAK